MELYNSESQGFEIQMDMCSVDAGELRKAMTGSFSKQQKYENLERRGEKVVIEMSCMLCQT